MIFGTGTFGLITTQAFQALEWRFIGPIVGTRGSVVLGHPTEANVFYHGASNGLWKTEDAGTIDRSTIQDAHRSRRALADRGILECGRTDPRRYDGAGRDRSP